MQLQITETQKRSNYQYFLFFLNFNLAKGGASGPLAPSLVAPLSADNIGGPIYRSVSLLYRLMLKIDLKI